jgi:hypothetical protein
MADDLNEMAADLDEDGRDEIACAVASKAQDD